MRASIPIALASLLAGCPASTPPPGDGGDLGAVDGARTERATSEARPGELGTRCGDGRAEGSEACDGADLRGQSCASLGLLGGVLGCAADCRFDVGTCTSCGNGTLEGPELCDGTELRGETCVSQGFAGGGKLTCGPGCSLDTSGCSPGLPGHATLVYGTGTEVAIRALELATKSWSAPWSAPLGGTAHWVVHRSSPLDPQDELAAVASAGAASQQLHLLRRTSGSWTIEPQSLPASLADSDKRLFDLAYEGKSGEALLVFSDETPNPRFRTYATSTGWSPPAPVFATPPGKGKVRWVVLASRPRSDELALVYSDHDPALDRWNLYRVIWNGASFDPASALVLTETSGDTPGLGRPTQAFDAAYEDQSGDLLVVQSNACCSCLGYDIRLANGATSSGANTACASWTFQRLVAQRGGSGLALVGDHGSAVIWSGVFFYPAVTTWPGPSSSGMIVWADVAWVGSQPVAITVQRGWSDPNPPGGSGALHWLRSSTAGTWVTPPPFAVPGLGAVERVQLEAFPKEDRVLAAFADDAKSLWVATYDLGKGWALTNGGAPVVSKTLSSTATRAFGISISQ